MTNANCTQRFPRTCEILMFQDQASSFSAQVLFQPSIISSQGFFQPDCFSSLEFNPAKVLFHVRRETILEWTFSRQGLFQPRAFSRQKLFPGMYRFQPHADHPLCLDKLLWLSRLRHGLTARLFEGPQLVLLVSNSSSPPPTCPFIVWHASSWFCTPDPLAIPGFHTPKY